MTTINTPQYSQGGRAIGSLSGWERNEDIDDLTLQEVNYSVDDLIKKIKQLRATLDDSKIQKLTDLLSKHISDHENPHRDTLAMLDPDVVNGFLAPYFPGSVPSDVPVYSLSALSSMELNVPAGIDGSLLSLDINPQIPGTPAALDPFITFASANKVSGINVSNYVKGSVPPKALINGSPVYVTQPAVSQGTVLSNGGTGASAGSYRFMGVNFNITELNNSSNTIAPTVQSGTGLLNIMCNLPKSSKAAQVLTVGTLRNIYFNAHDGSGLSDQYGYLVFTGSSGSLLVVQYNPYINQDGLCSVIYVSGDFAPVYENKGLVFGVKYNPANETNIQVSISTTQLDDWSTFNPAQAIVNIDSIKDSLGQIAPTFAVYDDVIDFVSPDGFENQISLIGCSDPTKLPAVSAGPSDQLYYTLDALSNYDLSDSWSLYFSFIVPSFLKENTTSYPVFISDGLNISVMGVKTDTKSSYTQNLTWTVSLKDTNGNTVTVNTTVMAKANQINTIALSYVGKVLSLCVTGNDGNTTVNQRLTSIPLSNSVLPSGIPLGLHELVIYDVGDSDDMLSFFIGDAPKITDITTGVS